MEVSTVIYVLREQTVEFISGFGLKVTVA